MNSASGDRSYPDSMKFGDQLATNDKDIAILFNEFFSSVFTKPDPTAIIPEVEKIRDPNLYLVQVEEDEVCKNRKGIRCYKGNRPG